MPKNQVSVKPESFATFGELLRYLRERLHLSQRELAGLVGYHYSYMSYFEKDMRAPDGHPCAWTRARSGINHQQREYLLIATQFHGHVGTQKRSHWIK
jgi:hypothetical protein